MFSNGIAENELRSLLLVRLGAMGDILHTLPAVCRLKQRFPRTRICWAVDPRWAPLLEGNPFLDERLEVPTTRWRRAALAPRTWREIWKMRAEMRGRGFDFAVDFQGLLKSAGVALLSGAERIYGFSREEARESLAAALYSHRVHPRAAHVAEKNLALVEAIPGPRPEREPPAFPLPAGRCEPWLEETDFFLASPLAGWRAKQWPEAHWAQLAALLWKQTGMPLVLDCAPEGREQAQAIAGAAPPGSCRLHVSTIEGLIGATRRARAVIGLDSGPMHLAAALGKPGVAVFGPTDPERNGPYGGSIRVLRAAEAATSYKRRGEPDPAMEAIGPGDVWRALEPQLHPAGVAPAAMSR